MSNPGPEMVNAAEGRVSIKHFAKRVISDHLTPEQEEGLVVRYWRFKNFVTADYEPECRVLARFISEGDTVLDLGVNMGQYASRMSRLVGKTGRVIGFEALPSTFRLAQRILTMPNVQLRNVAVSDRRGSLTMVTSLNEYDGINTGLTKVVGEDETAPVGHTVTVASEKLDEVLDHLDDRITFVKCDIEGHEVQAFRGGMNMLERDRPVLLVETGGKRFRELGVLLGRLGYRAMRLATNGNLASVEGEMAESSNVFFLSSGARS